MPKVPAKSVWGIGNRRMGLEELVGRILAVATTPALELTETLRSKGVITDAEAGAIFDNFAHQLEKLTGVKPASPPNEGPDG
jgi:hypothetical protein